MPELEVHVSKIAMRINSAYSSLTHQPLVFLRHDISYSQFLALMNVAEILIVSSLREGMNLTSHDYVNSQDGKLAPQRHGSLILSEFTGSASIFVGHELLVNPWDYQEVADTINKALGLSPEQKQRNWQFLLDRMASHTALSWVSSFRECLVSSHKAQFFHRPSQVPSLSVNALKKQYESSSTRLIFLEDEATFARTTSTSPREPSSLLEPLTNDPKNQVYITSNKSPEQLAPLITSLPPRIGYIAENGCFKRDIGSHTWEALLDPSTTTVWTSGIRKVMTYFHGRTPGSRIEQRRCLLTFHYHDAHDPFVAARSASDLAAQISAPGGRPSETVRVVCTPGAVSAEPLHVTKATAAEAIWRGSSSRRPDFVFVAGGSRGDEALFRFANALGGGGDDNGDQGGGVTFVSTLTAAAGCAAATEARAMVPDHMGVADIIGVLASPEVDLVVR